MKVVIIVVVGMLVSITFVLYTRLVVVVVVVVLLLLLHQLHHHGHARCLALLGQCNRFTLPHDLLGNVMNSFQDVPKLVDT